eukprot:12527421-Alexandrium_andersonii.AAC.1
MRAARSLRPPRSLDEVKTLLVTVGQTAEGAETRILQGQWSDGERIGHDTPLLLFCVGERRP